MSLLGYALAFLLGVPTAIAAIAVHRSVAGLVLGLGTTLFVMWTLRQWLPRTATAFAAGWLLPLVLAVAGRPEGDYVVASDAYGWALIGSGFVVLVMGIVWGQARRQRERPRPVARSA